jgi:hypothetical protein
MAWLTADLESIRRYLGFPVSQNSYTQIQTQMNKVAGVASGAAIATGQDLLTQLAAINTAINTARTKAGVADEVTDTTSTSYYKGMDLLTLRSEGRRNVRELASLLDY